MKKDIYLPHLNYTVKVRDFKKAPEDIPGAKSYVESGDNNYCTMYVETRGGIHPGDLSHELVHVLQFICRNRNIEFTLEIEHMAYIMHYLFGQIMGYKFQD